MTISIFITIGLLLAGALGLDAIGRRTQLPRVTLLILFGLIIGRSGLNLLPEHAELLYRPIAQLALTMVSFLLGGKFSRKFMRESGGLVVGISLFKVLGALVIVLAGLLLVGASWQVALLLAAIATATDPVTTSEVLQENDKQSRFTETLSAVVALDDLWGIMTFSLSLTLVSLYAGSTSVFDGVSFAAWEILGGFGIGALLGIPVAYLSGRGKSGEPTQLEALATIFLCAGLAMCAEVSFLLTAMVAGAVIANLASHHTCAFHEIERIDRPFLILFFILAGASLQVNDLSTIGLLGGAYVVTRTLGTYAGSWLGGWITGATVSTRQWIGLALLPQAGVALGMAVVASDQFPNLQSEVLTVAIGSTVAFEIFGPIVTHRVVKRIA